MVTAPPTLPWIIRAGPSFTDRAAARQAMIFDYCKWDPQVGDADVLCWEPLILSATEAESLARATESLAAETLAAEAELLDRPELWSTLAFPWRLRRALHTARRGRATAPNNPVSDSLRIMRFDFHPTPEGWRLSEVNSDVPGGFGEATGMPRLVAPHVSDTNVAGDPVKAIVNAVARNCSTGAAVALVHATAYTDDRQVMVLLARELERRGLAPLLVGPDAVYWENGHARIRQEDGTTRAVDALLRFFPAEWLPALGWRSDWHGYFRPGVTPMGNPATALLTQNKRWSLTWPRLRTPLPTWRRLLPATCDPREVDRRDSDWLFKPALGRVGEDILPGGEPVPRNKEERRREKQLRRHPSKWVAQRRFESLPWTAHDGQSRHVCVGAYAVGGRFAGFYGRASTNRIINATAADIPVLVANPILS